MPLRRCPLLIPLLLLGAAGAVRAAEYAIGADLSFLKQAEAQGTVFKEQGQARPGLQLFKEHGYGWVRLRLVHTPTKLPNDRAYTLAMAKEAKKLGFKVLLDLHYSDTWADPAHQTLPKAWEGKSHAELVEAVFAYTRDTLNAFRAAEAMPDMVQIGNEVIGGMLWPDGKLPENWEQFADLVKAGVRGVRAGSGEMKSGQGQISGRPVVTATAEDGRGTRHAPRMPRIMIHIDRGGDKARTKWFFDKLNSYGVEYDVIGQSFYPWWHGSLLDLRENLAFMAEAYQKDIILVEVAYCWRPTEYKQRPGPFPETPEGQRDFLDEVNRLVLQTPHGRGAGVFWWEPAVSGGLRCRGFFGDDGNALPVLSVFDRFTRK